MKRILAIVAFLCASPWIGSVSASTVTPGNTSEVKLTDGGSYVLFVPRKYSPEQRWPILYCFDARGHGLDALERFRDAAERFGWIVASSNDSRSDEATSPNPAAARAMWSDTHAKLSIDDRRIYASGFSGGARAACLMREFVSHPVTGVIGASGGFPFGEPPSPTTPFDFFGTAGNRDFNYYELRDLDRKLASLGLAHALVLFDGGHEWPPATIASRAIAWMEVRAMRKGLRKIDPALITDLYAEEIKAVAAETESVRTAEAYARVIDEFNGLADVRDIEEKRAAVVAAKGFAELESADLNREKRDLDYLELAAKLVGSIGAPEPPSVGQLSEALDLRTWKKRADDRQHIDEMLSAKRVLSTLLVQSGYYVPGLFRERGDAKREAIALMLATEIKPEEPSLWFSLAAARAAAGEKRAAFDALSKAVERGFHDREAVANEKRFDALRRDPKFLAIVGRM